MLRAMLRILCDESTMCEHQIRVLSKALLLEQAEAEQLAAHEANQHVRLQLILSLRLLLNSHYSHHSDSAPAAALHTACVQVLVKFLDNLCYPRSKSAATPALDTLRRVRLNQITPQKLTNLIDAIKQEAVGIGDARVSLPTAGRQLRSSPLASAATLAAGQAAHPQPERMRLCIAHISQLLTEPIAQLLELMEQAAGRQQQEQQQQQQQQQPQQPVIAISPLRPKLRRLQSEGLIDRSLAEAESPVIEHSTPQEAPNVRQLPGRAAQPQRGQRSDASGGNNSSSSSSSSSSSVENEVDNEVDNDENNDNGNGGGGSPIQQLDLFNDETSTQRSAHRRRVFWQAADSFLLFVGHAAHGNSWVSIKCSHLRNCERTNVQLKDRWRSMVNCGMVDSLNKRLGELGFDVGAVRSLSRKQALELLNRDLQLRRILLPQR